MRNNLIRVLAHAIAEDFNREVSLQYCKDFKELRRLYDWEASDIRSEIEYMVNSEMFPEGAGIAMMDDGSLNNLHYMEDPDNYCSYGTFKKMIFKNVR